MELEIVEVNFAYTHDHACHAMIVTKKQLQYIRTGQS